VFLASPFLPLALVPERNLQPACRCEQRHLSIPTATRSSCRVPLPMQAILPTGGNRCYRQCSPPPLAGQRRLALANARGRKRVAALFASQDCHRKKRGPSSSVTRTQYRDAVSGVPDVTTSQKHQSTTRASGKTSQGCPSFCTPEKVQQSYRRCTAVSTDSNRQFGAHPSGRSSNDDSNEGRRDQEDGGSASFVIHTWDPVRLVREKIVLALEHSTS